MRHPLPAVARCSLGAAFLVFGLDGFLNFLPKPRSVPLNAGMFLGALDASGYFFPLLKGTETAIGILLLLGRFVPLALIAAAAIIVNIVAFHVFLWPSGALIPIAMFTAAVALAWWYRDAFRSAVVARTAPRGRESP